MPSQRRVVAAWKKEVRKDLRELAGREVEKRISYCFGNSLKPFAVQEGT